MKRLWAAKSILGAVGLLSAAVTACAQDASQWMNTMLAHENQATSIRGRYLYANEERSDRTGGHLWREWVAETDWGKVHYLVAEDGKPLPADRQAAERNRLAQDAAHPEDFKQRELNKADSEAHARQMLNLLPKAFVLETPQVEADGIRIPYHPNPDYQPANLEEKVLHGMTGTVLIDPREVRMKSVEGHTKEDISLSFGFATIKAGSNFSTQRAHVEGPDWKLQQVHSDIRGKAVFMKLVRQQDVKHGDFHKIPDGLTVAAAVELLEKQN